MEGGSPGNPEGVHQSGAWGLEPGVWSSSRWGGGKCWRITLACGGEVEVGQAQKEGRRGAGGKDGEVRAGNAGQSGGGEWNVSQEAFSAPWSVRMRASAVGVAAQTATGQRGSSCVTQSSSQTHTHILQSVTPHRLGRAHSSYIL